MSETQDNVPDPVEGKYIFQVDPMMQIRMNADGWVEEIGKTKRDTNLGTRLQGRPGTKLDDIYGRRYYDLFSRVVIVDIYPHRQSDQSGSGGIIAFKDLEEGSVIYKRVQTAIDIANKHFGFSIASL